MCLKKKNSVKFKMKKAWKHEIQVQLNQNKKRTCLIIIFMGYTNLLTNIACISDVNLWTVNYKLFKRRIVGYSATSWAGR